MLGYIVGTGHAFGHDDHEVCPAAQAGPTDGFNDIPFEIHLPLRHQHAGGPAGHAHIESQVPCAAPHYFHHRAALMGLHGVAQFIDGVQGSIASGVKPDGIGGAGNVIVDGTGHAYHGDSHPGELQKTAEGAVAADADKALQAQQLTGGRCFLLTGLPAEFFTPGGVEHGAAPAAQAADAFKIQRGEVSCNQAVIPPADTNALNTHVQRGADHGTDCGVHTGRVTAAGKHADTAYCTCHTADLLISFRPLIPHCRCSRPPHGAPGPASRCPPGTPSPAPGSGRYSGRAPDGR